jgi:hypothetical protein
LPWRVQIKAIGQTDPDYDYAKIAVDNFIGKRLVRYGWGASFGKAATMAVFRKGAKSGVRAGFIHR